MPNDANKLWLPPGSVVPERQRNTKTLRPFAQLGKQVERMGFKCRLRADPKARTVEVEFLPLTEKMKKAVRKAADDGNVNALRVAASYDLPSEEGQAVLACIEHGLRQIKAEVL